MSKLKVGDKVIVTRASTEKEDGSLWKNCWVSRMDRFIGQVVTIRYIVGDFSEVTIKEDGGDCGWPKFVLEKVPVQLEFNFMSEA